MAKYLSSRQQNLKIGIVSYTEDKTVLEVTGKVGIGTTNAQYSLDVVGDINFTGTFYEDGNQFVASRWTSGDGSEIYRLSNVGIGTTNTQGYELYVNGDANITGIVSATSYFGSGGNLEDIITNISLTKLEGLEVKEEGVGIGTTFTAINFVGSGVTASASGNTAVITITQPVSGISVRYNNINIGTGITSLNFSGTGISSVTSNVSGISTVIVDLQGNLDGGTPTTNYGGIDSIEGGGI